MSDLEQRVDSACGCCSDEIPPRSAHVNRPGLPAIDYRIARYGDALRRMLARIHRQTVPPAAPSADPQAPLPRPLLDLRTRASNDPAIALLDAWAVVVDVLTFYQERFANEHYLRTATERRSVLELARAIGYELKPGVAASAYLAFTVEDAPGAPGVAEIPAGTQVQSIPPPNQLPQTFETSAPFTAYAAWNALRPQTTGRRPPQQGDTSIYLAGTGTNLRPGDMLLFVGADNRWDLRRIVAVTPDQSANRTLVRWENGLWTIAPRTTPPANPATVNIYALRTRASIFGHNAPDWRSLPDETKTRLGGRATDTNWPNWTISDPIYLDREYPAIVPGSWLVLATPETQQLFRVERVVEVSRAEFTIAAKVSRITLSGGDLSPFRDRVRDTTVFAESVELAPGETPLERPITGDTITLDRIVPGLEPGRLAAISGKPLRALIAADGLRLMAVDDPGQMIDLRRGDILWTTAAPTTAGTTQTGTLRTLTGFVGTLTAAAGAVVTLPAAPDDRSISEVRTIKEVRVNDGRTVIVLDAAIAGYYDATTVTINANVVAATHGETVRETLGSGDGARAHQRFTLKKPPLTFTSAPTITGIASSLAVRVDGVLWEAAPSLYPLGPRDERYIVRIDDDGRATVTFGDGARGARLPTGAENVTAVYRSGIGMTGEVAADSLTILKTRPQGVRAVTNPLAASGAEDPETRDQARANAPLTILTLDRIVSLQDVEHFARTFPGIGKAQAIDLWNGAMPVVHLTVATASGKPLPAGDPLYANLTAAINAARDPLHPVLIDTFVPRQFNLRARLRIDPRLLFDDVAAAVRTALLHAFSFAQRSFGQQVTAAEVMTVIQGVKGVIMVDLDVLALAPATGGAPAVLGAQIARRDGDVIRRAELLLINPGGIVLEEIAS